MWSTRSSLGLSPSSGLSVSITRPQPEIRMNAATPTPIRPSSTSQPVTRHSTAAMSTALVLSTSLRLSAAVAMRVSEPMIRPMVRLKPLIHSLTRMDAISTATVSQLNTTGVGCSTLTTDSFSSEKPMPRMVTLTTSPARYSYRAWPKGCSASGALPASLKPTRLTTLDEASDRLFRASAMMAMEPNRVPTVSLPRHSSRLHATPTQQARLP